MIVEMDKTDVSKTSIRGCNRVDSGDLRLQPCDRFRGLLLNAFNMIAKLEGDLVRDESSKRARFSLR